MGYACLTRDPGRLDQPGKIIVYTRHAEIRLAVKGAPSHFHIWYYFLSLSHPAGTELKEMQFVEGILIALEALWANKLRTMLTLLGNIVGVMSVIAVVSIIDGMNSYIRNEVAHEGSGVYRVQQVNELDILSDFDKFLKSLHNPKITVDDLDYLRERVTLAETLDANQTTSAEVRFQRRYVKSATVQGRSDNYPAIGNWELTDGRHFIPLEVQHSQLVAVIGFDIADKLYPDVDPIGKEIKIAGIQHRIIGVLKKRAGVF